MYLASFFYIYFFLIHLSPAATCGAAPEIENAVAIDRNFFDNASVAGSFVEYNCRSPYVLTDYINRITCQDNGVWSEPKPRCELRRSGEVTCGRVPTIENGTSRTNVPAFQLSNVGDRISYGCQAGFTLVGNPTVVCEETGSWSRLPRCQVETGGSQPRRRY